MRELLFFAPQDHQPVRFHRWAQEEIAWGLRDAPGEMSVPSITGRMMEGHVRAVGIDIAEDMWGAFEQAKTRLEAAERFRVFAGTIRDIGLEQASVLDKVYGDAVAETDLLAFGGAANLFPESVVAHEFHKRSRTSQGFISWAGELRVHVAGERYEDKRVKGKWHRHPPRASETEKAIAAEIKRDIEKMLITALAAYAMARPRRR